MTSTDKRCSKDRDDALASALALPVPVALGAIVVARGCECNCVRGIGTMTAGGVGGDFVLLPIAAAAVAVLGSASGSRSLLARAASVSVEHPVLRQWTDTNTTKSDTGTHMHASFAWPMNHAAFKQSVRPLRMAETALGRRGSMILFPPVDGAVSTTCLFQAGARISTQRLLVTKI